MYRPLSFDRAAAPATLTPTPTDPREFELLASHHEDEDAHSFIRHEVQTAPLVSRDALDVGERFAQRGLLGSVLSVHSKALPGKPLDRRIYMNLDAPSSGLVCGVQGSGKSHTVSCIMESSMMVDERIGSLPAPLATVVFHYDEENGQRPCEAAFLSELKDRSGPGIQEVTVLVSPSNLNKRMAVYKELKHVQVLPLKIAESDLNAARMLSLMGATNLEGMPLYLSTALSILRELGTDNFTYGAFNENLKLSKFNSSQKAMLQQRLSLLNSFLKGDGGDISSFFKEGRLVVIDLSDPFVDATTAALLFDICLGLFIEWKASSGKLIVLDEAHKYLTNADANQFTKSICSIIRQQRHLAARVVVSTQEPTVVPDSILGLLSWVICHRFSSPSWTSHLSQHICIKNAEGDSDVPDWSERVMTLATGQALLYSPPSLFVSRNRTSAMLAAGYAIIKTRGRLTLDGGASLLATGAHGEYSTAVHKGTGLMTPPSVHTSPVAVPVTEVDIAQPSAIRGIALPQRNEPDPILISKPSLSTPHATPLSSNQVLPPPPVATVATVSSTLSASGVNNTSSMASTPSNDTAAHGHQPRETFSVPAAHRVLVDALQYLHSTRSSLVSGSSVAAAMRARDPNSYTPGKFSKYLKLAEEENIVRLEGGPTEFLVSLNPLVYWPEEFRPLYSALPPGSFVSLSALGSSLISVYKAAGYLKLKAFIQAAQQRELVVMRAGDKQDEVALKL